jgi:hypothetical protein
MVYGKDIAIAAVQVDGDFLKRGANVGDSGSEVYLKLLNFLETYYKSALESDINKEFGKKIKGIVFALHGDPDQEKYLDITTFVIPHNGDQQKILSSAEKDTLNVILEKYISGIGEVQSFYEVTKQKYDELLEKNFLDKIYKNLSKENPNVITIISDIVNSLPEKYVGGI